MYHRTAVMLILAFASVTGCLGPRHHASGRALGSGAPESAVPTRAGIAVVGRGGIAGWEQVTILDSATARYMTVTRGPCGVTCTPFDSASGVLTPSDVSHIYDVIREEKVFSLDEDYGTCPNCGDEPVVTTAVFANNRRKVITSNGEATPQIHGRVHVALAEAIRSARETR